MILRNHGLLTVGEAVADAFVWMYRLDRACKVQVMANGTAGFAKPSRQAAAFSAKGAKDFASGYGACAPGVLEFAAFKRLMDQIDPSFRD
jgi:ribulose-5-phosphate 4-epimerase/fuculose-1-phosphate aldolase